MKLGFWFAFFVPALAVILLATQSAGQDPKPADAKSEDKRDPSVGAAGFLSDLILPGTELRAKPLQEGAPIIVRITQSIRHGDQYRYFLTFHGLEPGEYDLAQWLERKDGSSTDDLPEINVEIRSLLPSGQIEPNPLAQGWLPKLGGYRTLLFLAIGLWTVILFVLIFAGRKKEQVEITKKTTLSLADLLRSRITHAIESDLSTAEYAELERVLFGYWRRRLKLEESSPDAALAEIKGHQEAGPLINQLEQWMHNPNAAKNVDFQRLLKPYQDLPADTPGFEK